MHPVHLVQMLRTEVASVQKQWSRGSLLAGCCTIVCMSHICSAAPAVRLFHPSDERPETASDRASVSSMNTMCWSVCELNLATNLAAILLALATDWLFWVDWEVCAV